MNMQRRMDVRHSKYGWGYVFLIAEDYLLVNFDSGSRIEFPIAAMEDGTLQMSGYTRVQFGKMREARGRRRRGESGTDSPMRYCSNAYAINQF